MEKEFDYKALVIYDFSSLNLQEISSGNCFSCDSCDCNCDCDSGDCDCNNYCDNDW